MLNKFATNWKTSTPAIIAALVNMVSLVVPGAGTILTPEVVSSINVLALTIIGLFARDYDKSSEQSGAK